MASYVGKNVSEQTQSNHDGHDCELSNAKLVQIQTEFNFQSFFSADLVGLLIWKKSRGHRINEQLHEYSDIYT